MIHGPHKTHRLLFLWLLQLQREQHYSSPSPSGIKPQQGGPPPIDQSPCTHQTVPVQQPSHSPTCCQGRPPNRDPAESTHMVLSSSRFATSNKSTTTIKSKVDVPKICIHAVDGFEIQKTNDSRVVSHVITNDSLGSKA